MTRFPITIVPALVLALGSLTLIPGCGKEEAAGPPPPPEVEVVTVEQKDIPVYREWVGTLAGDVNATISAQVSGYLQTQNYKEGQVVKAGDLLFEIDPRPFQAALDQANARLKKTELDVARYTPLAATEAISKQELDNAIQANLSMRAEVEQAALNLNFTKITSPIDGVAGLAKAQIGDLVGPATGPLTTVTKIDPMRVYVSIDQKLMTELAEKTIAQGKSLRPDDAGKPAAAPTGKAPLELILATGQVYSERGRILFADNQLDVRTGTIRVVGQFPNPQGLLVAGMFTRVRALMDTQKDAIVVPQRAVTDMQGRSLIAVVGPNNKVNIRPVETGERFGDLWVIKGNVKPGDRVIAEGVQKVREGFAVNPVPFANKVVSSASASPASATATGKENP